MAQKFDYSGARKAGYSDEEIMQHLSEMHPDFDILGAQESGYSPTEINQYLAKYQPERSTAAKLGRLGVQAGVSGLEMAAIPYELGVAPLASEGAQHAEYRKNLFEDIERLSEQKQTGVWDDQDENLLKNLIEQVKNPESAQQFVKTADIGVRGTLEKATGTDLHPEGFLEKAVGWWGAMKNPKKLLQATKNLAKAGITAKDVLKTVVPGRDALASLGAGAGLQMAEDGQFGPIGTLAAATTGFALGHTPSAAKYAIQNPKKALAQATNLFTGGNSKKAWTEQLLEDAKKAGVQLDAGTIKDSNLLRWLQARAAQSALSGKALDNFRQELSGQMVRELDSIYGELGNLTFENNYQAAESIKDFLKTEKDELFGRNAPFVSEKTQARPLAGRVAMEERPAYQEELLNRIAPQEFENSYQAGENLKTAAEDIKQPIKEEFNERWENFNHQVEQLPAEPQGKLVHSLDRFIENHEGSLLLGEHAPESRVLQAAQKLRDRLATADNSLVSVSLSDLIKTKRTLAGIADFEFGGSNFQSAYKSLVADVDRAIENTLRTSSPEMLEQYQRLNAEYSHYKDLFENKNMMPLFEPKNQNYNSIYNSFIANPDKLRALEDIFFFSTRGQELINQIKRDYARRVIENPNLSERDIRNLSNVLGPDFAREIENFSMAHQYARENPVPRIARQQRLGAQVELPSARGIPIKGAKESQFHARQKLYEYLRDKTPEQVMKMMDTVDGIRKLKRVLVLTDEGKKLFGELSRFKLYEMIDKNMKDNVTQNVKLGTFSGLLKSTENKAVVKELIGAEGYEKLARLQSLSGKLAASADKFYNASKSGTTLADIATVSTLMLGLFTGNPYMILSSAGHIGGTKIAGYLLSDAKFLKYLEEAALTSNKEKFQKLLKKMEPSIDAARKKMAIEIAKNKEAA